MSKKFKFVQILVSAAILLGLFLPMGYSPQAADPAGIAKIQPALLSEIAAAAPDEMVRIIVQKADSSGAVEAYVQELGGQVLSELDLINAFVALLPGKQISEFIKTSAVNWVALDAPVISASIEPGSHTYRDEFNQEAYNGSDGTENWAGTPWVEFGESNGGSTGYIEVLDDRACVSDYCLEIEGDDHMQPWGVYRPVNLDGIASATLTFQYKRVYEINHRRSICTSLFRQRRYLDDAGYTGIGYQRQRSPICAI